MPEAAAAAADEPAADEQVDTSTDGIKQRRVGGEPACWHQSDRLGEL